MRLYRAVIISLMILFSSLVFPGELPSIAIYYGNDAPLDELKAFDITIIDPDHGFDPNAYRTNQAELFAYVSVGEVQPSRTYFKKIPSNWRIGTNQSWGSIVIDQSVSEWPAFFADNVVAPLWRAGYRGLFLDTLDSYHLVKNVNARSQQQGLIAVIRELRKRFPGIRLIANRGFEILPSVSQDLYAIAAESLFRGWDASKKQYVSVPEEDRKWLLGQLNVARNTYSLPVLAIDYVNPNDRALTRKTAQEIAGLGFIPWVSDGDLRSLGIGSVEVVPRKVLVLYDSLESISLAYSNAHLYIDMPLNYLGYVPEHVDVQKTLPSTIVPGRYAGIVSWYSGDIGGNRKDIVADWIKAQINTGIPIAMLGNFGIGLDDKNTAMLGLSNDLSAPIGKLRVTNKDKMIGLEAQPMPDRKSLLTIRLKDNTDRSLLQIQDRANRKYDAAAITKWGGFVLGPFDIVQVPGQEFYRWVIDPFEFLKQALRLPAAPMPDITTESGRRFLMVHIDGDGFPSKAEIPGAPFASEVLLDQILTKYKLPTTASVIEAEVSPDGLYPQFSPKLEAIAKKIFALPYVEIASHTYSHPFNWAKAEANQNPDDPDAYYALKIPGYSINITREILGSINYIRQRLAPRGKPVSILLWSGNAVPGASSLKLTYDAGLLNMNGGETAITKSNPTITAVWANGIEKDGYFQIYAPVTNENIYTNLWHGPFYGFERVIETFMLTEKPRRLKPINIYYHTYSASKQAGLTALHKVYNWALKQSTYPIYASEFIHKAMEFNHAVVARKKDAWLVRTGKELRTVRLPKELGTPSLENSRNLAGYKQGQDGTYLHMTGPEATIVVGDFTNDSPYLSSANAKVIDWQKKGTQIEFRLAGHMPLELTMGKFNQCILTTEGKQLGIQYKSNDLAKYSLKDAAATFQVKCEKN